MPNTIQIGSGSGGIGNYLLTFTAQAISPALGLAVTGPYYYPGWCNTNSILNRVDVSTINGNTTVSIPAGTAGIIIIPPVGSTVAKTIRGISGDTGLPIHPQATFAWALPTSGAPSSFVINANGIEILTVEFV